MLSFDTQDPATSEKRKQMAKKRHIEEYGKQM